MVNVNEIQEAIYEHYVDIVQTNKIDLPFLKFFDAIYTKYDLTYFDGFLFLYKKEDNSVHVHRSTKFRNKIFSHKTMEKYFNSLPIDVTAPIKKTANPVAKRIVEKFGFVLTKETETHYVMQRISKC